MLLLCLSAIVVALCLVAIWQEWRWRAVARELDSLRRVVSSEVTRLEETRRTVEHEARQLRRAEKMLDAIVDHGAFEPTEDEKLKRASMAPRL
jgi:cell division protein FtsL